MGVLESSLRRVQTLIDQVLALNPNKGRTRPGKKSRKFRSPNLEGLLAYQLVAAGLSYRAAYYQVVYGVTLRPKAGATSEEMWKTEWTRYVIHPIYSKEGKEIDFVEVEEPVKPGEEKYLLKGVLPPAPIVANRSATPDELRKARKEAARSYAAGVKLVELAIRKFGLARIPGKHGTDESELQEIKRKLKRPASLRKWESAQLNPVVSTAQRLENPVPSTLSDVLEELSHAPIEELKKAKHWLQERISELRATIGGIAAPTRKRTLNQLKLMQQQLTQLLLEMARRQSQA